MRQKITVVFTSGKNLVKKLKLVKNTYIMPLSMDQLTIRYQTAWPPSYRNL